MSSRNLECINCSTPLVPLPKNVAHVEIDLTSSSQSDESHSSSSRSSGSGSKDKNKLNVKSAIWSIYNLSHFEQQIVRSQRQLGKQDDDIVLCENCSKVLVNLYKCFNEFKLLRTNHSFLNQRIHKLNTTVKQLEVTPQTTIQNNNSSSNSPRRVGSMSSHDDDDARLKLPNESMIELNRVHRIVIESQNSESLSLSHNNPANKIVNLEDDGDIIQFKASPSDYGEEDDDEDLTFGDDIQYENALQSQDDPLRLEDEPQSKRSKPCSSSGQTTTSNACKLCKEIFTTLPAFYKHYELSHVEGTDGRVCMLCQRSYSSKSSLMTHIRSHIQYKPYYCGLCPQNYCSKGEIVRHCKRFHKVPDYEMTKAFYSELEF